jgi:Rho termination factor, N-terminal domain
MEIKPSVMGPPAFGSPDPGTAAAYLAPVVDHPLKATFSDDYGADVADESQHVSGITGDEEGPSGGGAEEGHEAMTVEELKDEARDKEIEGFSTMKKAELVSALDEYDEAQAALNEE